jgi:Putative  PD-(D/E)XK family member, (DUF4420)
VRPHSYPTVETLVEHLAGGAPALFRVDGPPDATIDVDTATDSVGVRVAWDGSEVPSLAGYDRLSCGVVVVTGTAWAEIRVLGRSLIPDGYRLLLAILDRVLDEGLNFASAVMETLDRFDSVLDEVHGLGLERELGLWGELTLLLKLIETQHPARAIEAWQGPTGGEHDFTLPEGDVEVKTTSLERRIHWFSDPHQLRPTLGRRLWVLSIQVTPSVGEGTRTLPELVAALRNDARVSLSARDPLEAGLAASGWRDGRDELYLKRWRLRTAPVTFEVTDAFPGITESLLEASGFPAEHLVELRQRLDLESWPTSAESPLEALHLGG